MSFCFSNREVVSNKCNTEHRCCVVCFALLELEFRNSHLVVMLCKESVSHQN